MVLYSSLYFFAFKSFFVKHPEFQMSDRKNNEVDEDFLDTDGAIRGQEYCCLSFISPEKVLEKKDLFFFREFMKFYEAKIRFDTLEKFLAQNANSHNDTIEKSRQELTGVFSGVDLSGLSPETKSRLHDFQESLDNTLAGAKVNLQDTFDSFREYVSQNREVIASKENIQKSYDDFMFNKEEELDDRFHQENEFRTSVRGLKVRGVYSTYKEACVRAKKLQKNDPAHNVYIGQVGYWLPWDPNPSRVGEQEYAEKELNDLMKKYKENDSKRKEIFEQEKNERVRVARNESNANNEDGSTNLRITDSQLQVGEAENAPASAEQVQGITEAREIMAEMEANRIPVNPSEVQEVIDSTGTTEN
jgi:hypothetical protein